MVDAIRRLFVGNPVGNDPWIARAWSIGITLVLAALAIWRYRGVVAR